MNLGPAFPFYSDDFMGSDNVTLMTLDEVGAYLLLLIFQWNCGYVPAEIPKLARICKNVSIKRMTFMWISIAPCFEVSEIDGQLINAKMDSIRRERLEFKEAKSKSGHNGGIASGQARAKQKGSTPSISLEANTQAKRTSPSPLALPKEGNVNNSSIPPLAISSPGEPKYNIIFQSFWGQSTQRGSKPEAWKEFQKLTSGHPEIVPAINAGMKAWKASEQWQDETKQTHIGRWLKRRGWEEKIPKSSVGNGTHNGFIEKPSDEPHPQHYCGLCDPPHDWQCSDPEICGISKTSACPELAARYAR